MIIVKPKSRLLINGESIQFEFTAKKPNRFRRFWQWLLLGWVWRDV